MSKQLQLVGIGNALVDLQFEVSEQELNDFEFQKGTMTLVSAEKQKQLISSLNNRKHIKCSGGSAANTIIAFTGFGGKSAYQSVIGNDSFGEFYETH